MNLRSIAIKFVCAAGISLAFYSCAPEEENTTTTTPTDPKQKWVASWNCAETSKLNTPPNSNFTMHVLDSANTSYVIIENLYNVGFNYKVKGLVSGSNMSIALQQLTSGMTVTGSATMVNNNTVNMNYVVDMGGGTVDSCTAVLSK